MKIDYNYNSLTAPGQGWRFKIKVGYYENSLANKVSWQKCSVKILTPKGEVKNIV